MTRPGVRQGLAFGAVCIAPIRRQTALPSSLCGRIDQTEAGGVQLSNYMAIRWHVGGFHLVDACTFCGPQLGHSVGFSKSMAAVSKNTTISGCLLFSEYPRFRWFCRSQKDFLVGAEKDTTHLLASARTSGGVRLVDLQYVGHPPRAVIMSFLM